MAGQEGFEPPTCGFGDRRSTIGATGLRAFQDTLAGFLVQSVTLAPLAVLPVLDALGVVLLVLLGRIISALAIGAGQRDQSSH